LREYEALASLKHMYLGSFFLDPKEVRSVIRGQSGTLVKEQGYHALDIRLRGEKGLPKGLGASGPKGLEPTYYSILF